MQQEVINAIGRLIKKNKQPSVALIKATLTHKVPMPVIIDVLSQYKKSPDSFEFEEATTETTPTHSIDLTDKSQLDRIEEKLDLLINLLKKQ